MRESVIQKNSTKWILFAVFMMGKFSYYQWQYTPVLDDWIQYGEFRLFEHPFQELYLNGTLYTMRPLAGLFDIYVWSPMFNHMTISLIIITLLHIGAICLIDKVLQTLEMPIGLLGLIIMGGLPLSMEGTYWMSASSRLVVGLFLMSVSLYWATKMVQNQRYIVPTMMVHLTSLLFYEQITALSCTALFLLIGYYIYKGKSKGYIGIPIVNAGLVALYYIYFMPRGASAARGVASKMGILPRSKELLKMLYERFVTTHSVYQWMDFKRGMRIVLRDGRYWYLAFVILLAGISCYLLWQKSHRSVRSGKHKGWVMIALGSLLFMVPYIPFTVIENGGSALRNTLPSCIGLGLIVEGIWSLLRTYPYGRYIYSAMTAGIICLFLITHVSNLEFYHTTSETDKAIGSEIVRQWKVLSGSGNEKDKLIYIYNGKESYHPSDSLYGQRILNATKADWSLTGLIRTMGEDKSIPYVVLIPNLAQRAETLAHNEGYKIGIEEQGKVVVLNQALKDEDSSISLIRRDASIFGFWEQLNEEKWLFTYKNEK